MRQDEYDEDAGRHDAWDDPNVTRALKDGRQPNDIMLGCCQRCHNYAYWNQGSHFTCYWCGWSVRGPGLEELIEMAETLSLEEYGEMMADEGDVP